MYLVRSGAIHGFEKLVSRYQVNPITLIKQTGLSPSNFRNPNTYISYSKMAELLERCAEACEQPLFGLMLADTHSLEVLGDLPVSIAAESSLGEALRKFDQFLYLHASGVRVGVESHGREDYLTVDLSISTPLGLDQIIQMSIGHMAILVTSLIGYEKYSLKMSLRQNAPKNLDLSSYGFSRMIKFSGHFDGLVVSHDMLNREVFSEQDMLKRHFQKYLQHLQEVYPDNLENQIKDIIGRLLPSGECSVLSVSSSLDMSPRVLQKKLNALGKTYSDLLRETRMTIAEQHLSKGTITVTDLSLNLGYSEVSVFSRNFKEWFGMSPKEWRERHRKPI